MSKCKELWLRAARKVIIGNLKDSLEKSRAENIQKEVVKLSWRIGFNLYNMKQFYEALPFLELASKGTEKDKVADGQDITLHRNSDVHLYAGRCSLELFLLTRNHYHLETAYRHYTNAVDTMTVDLSTMFRLPSLLLEFGRVLEHYGAFSAALEVYSKILSSFPNFRGYFDAMYRSAIVGRHIAELCKNPKQREETIDKCIDILQFLLEALPSTINDLDVLLLYVRTLELSSNPATRFRANGVYQNLFEYCRSAKPAIANADTYSSFKSWVDDPATWINIGDSLKESEPLLARDGYENFVKRVERNRTAGKGVEEYLDLETCLKLAKNYASYQQYDTAVQYAEYALSKNHFHKETRACLAKWSKVHDISLTREKFSINSIILHWRQRVWTQNVRHRVQQNLVQEMEEKLTATPYDKSARDALSYYARDKWRARFLFETVCATRIQRKFREVRKHWKWLSAQRQMYGNKASNLYRRFLINPFDRDLRDAIRSITNQRLCPAKHKIFTIRKRIDLEDGAITRLQKCLRAYRHRAALYYAIQRRAQRRQDFRKRAAQLIQCAIRRKLSYIALGMLMEMRARYSAAAKIVQRFVRWRNGTFQHSVTRVLARQRARRAAARQTLAIVFNYQLRKFLHRRRLTQLELERLRQLEEERAHQLEEKRRMEAAVRCLQRLAARAWARKYGRHARRMMHARRRAKYAITSSHLLAQLIRDESAAYRIPGVRHNTKQFNSCLVQSTIYCSGSEFGPFDVVMLSAVLKSPSCSVQTLVLHDLTCGQDASFEFDLLTAISKCRSLRSIRIIGGDFKPNFLVGLLNEIQCENPRIRDVALEGLVQKSKGFSTTLGAAAGRLLCDYFNYSLPGLQHLSLHGCGLGNHDISMICSGLEVNSALKSLVLSLNVLTDEGFMAIFSAISNNNKSRLQYLDCSYNLIAMRAPVRELFDRYVHPTPSESLTVSLKHNMACRTYTSRISIHGREELLVDIGRHHRHRHRRHHHRHHHHQQQRPQRASIRSTASGTATTASAGVASDTKACSKSVKSANDCSEVAVCEDTVSREQEDIVGGQNRRRTSSAMTDLTTDSALEALVDVEPRVRIDESSSIENVDNGTDDAEDGEMVMEIEENHFTCLRTNKVVVEKCVSMKRIKSELLLDTEENNPKRRSSRLAGRSRKLDDEPVAPFHRRSSRLSVTESGLSSPDSRASRSRGSGEDEEDDDDDDADDDDDSVSSAGSASRGATPFLDKASSGRLASRSSFRVDVSTPPQRSGSHRNFDRQRMLHHATSLRSGSTRRLLHSSSKIKMSDLRQGSTKLAPITR